MGKGKATSFFAVIACLWAGAASALLLGVPPSEILSGLLISLGIAVGITYSLSYREKSRARKPAVATPRQPSPEELEERFVESNLLAKLSHELRTPLHNILGLIRILYSNSRSSTDKYYLRLLQEASTNLLGTINDVLDFSKADTAMLSVTKSRLQLDSLVRQALRSVAPQAFTKAGLELLCSWDREVPPFVVTDGTRIRQILINLLGNAIKFTSSGYVRLHVSTETRDLTQGSCTLRFTVTDTGAGIPASSLSTIFDPFSQVDMTVVRRASGTGLGLTIVKQLVTLLGGEIDVMSTLKKGSCFWFTVPVTIEHSDLTQLAANDSATLQETCVYLLGKSPHLIESLHTALTQLGVRVSSNSCATLHEELDFTSPDYLVVLDDALTSTTTWETISRFSAHRGYSSVIVLLSPSSIQLRERCSQLGPLQLLSLPVLSKDVSDALCGRYNETFDGEDGFTHISSQQSLNILIADDIPANQLILRTALEEAGHKVTAVGDGDELIAILRPQIESPATLTGTELFDVVFTDVEMPKLDGVSAIKQIRKLEVLCSAIPLPLFVVTAHVLDSELSRIRVSGATGTTTKPLNPREIEECLNSIERRSLSSASTQQPARAHKVPLELREAVTAKTNAPIFLATVDSILRTQRSEKEHYVPAINVRDIFERAGDSPRRTLLIMRSFLSSYNGLLDELKHIDDTSTAQQIGQLAHALKGLLAEVGATQGVEEAATLEALGKTADTIKLLPFVPRLVAHTEEVAAAVSCTVSSFDKNGEPLTSKE